MMREWFRSSPVLSPISVDGASWGTREERRRPDWVDDVLDPRREGRLRVEDGELDVEVEFLRIFDIVSNYSKISNALT